MILFQVFNHLFNYTTSKALRQEPALLVARVELLAYSQKLPTECTVSAQWVTALFDFLYNLAIGTWNL